MELGKSFASASLEGVSYRVKRRKSGTFSCRFLGLFLFTGGVLTLTRLLMPIFLLADVKTSFRHNNKPIVPEIIISVTRKSLRYKYGCITLNRAGGCSKMVMTALYAGSGLQACAYWVSPLASVKPGAQKCPSRKLGGARGSYLFRVSGKLPFAVQDFSTGHPGRS